MDKIQKWQDALYEAYKKQTMGDGLLDFGSMTLLAETSLYWLIRYDEGQAEFINLVYKDGKTEMETIEVR